MSIKRIVLSLSLIGLVGAAVAGATGAFFSTAVTSSNNTFNTTTLTFTVNNQSPILGPVIAADNFYPGAFAESVVAVAAGNIAVNPEISLANAVDPNGMAPFLKFEVWTNNGLYYSGPINQFPGYVTTSKVITETVTPNTTKYIGYRIVLDETAPNTLQAATYTVQFVMTGHQYNDPAFQPTAVVDSGTGAGAGRYVANNVSLPVCGVRDFANMPVLANGSQGAVYADKSNLSAYNLTLFSPYYSYNSYNGVTPVGWVIPPTITTDTPYQGGVTHPNGTCSVN